MASAEFVVALLTLLLTTLALTLPATQAQLQSCFQCFVCHLVPSRGYCYRLLLKDVPHGRLHQCHPNCQHVNPLTRDDHDRTNCWDDGWGQVLDRAWNLMKSDPADLRYRARTPFSLLFCGPYIQIDVQTLKVLLILTAEGNRTLETPDVTKSLDIRKIRGIQTVHLKTHGYRSINMSLTKQEVDRFVEGYPPFYSTIIKTTGGIYLEHPLNDSGKIGRGSWVLAVGMSTANGPVCTIHNMQTISSEKAEAGWEGLRGNSRAAHTLVPLVACGRQLRSRVSRQSEARNTFTILGVLNSSKSSDHLYLNQLLESAHAHSHASGNPLTQRNQPLVNTTVSANPITGLVVATNMLEKTQQATSRKHSAKLPSKSLTTMSILFPIWISYGLCFRRSFRLSSWASRKFSTISSIPEGN
ncbi:hypothetical protein DL95DRAFT_417699 [Leptodontidium sp. 2 PMI_412]|nr:hypothetical protein DL95DRAFT_417699 [Leptodontidium sp. 2 PMI_412]